MQQREIISRRDLLPYTRRSDIPGIVHIVTLSAAMGVTGLLVYLSLETLWFWPALFLHGVVINHHFAPLHETCHGTAFRSRWLNELVHRYCGLLIIFQPLFFRYSHTGHHTYAQEQGNDPEQIFPPPRTVLGYLYVVLGVQLWVRSLGWLFTHAAGRMTKFNRRFAPESELPRIYWEARLMLAVYGVVAIVSVWFGSWNAVIYWLGPLVLATPQARALRIGDHTGCADEMNVRTYARTIPTDPITRFLCWNMNYHCEHHLAPSVPFHQLPRLHQKVGQDLNPTDKGYIAVNWEVLTRHVSGFHRRPKISDAGMQIGR